MKALSGHCFQKVAVSALPLSYHPFSPSPSCSHAPHLPPFLVSQWKELLPYYFVRQATFDSNFNWYQAQSFISKHFLIRKVIFLWSARSGTGRMSSLGSGAEGDQAAHWELPWHSLDRGMWLSLQCLYFPGSHLPVSGLHSHACSFSLDLFSEL